MRASYRKIPTLKVIGLGAKFISALSPESNAAQVIPPLWHRFAGRRSEIPSRQGERDFGVLTCLIEKDKSHPDEMLYVACTQVRKSAKVPDGMTKIEIPRGTYAVFAHRGPIGKLGLTLAFVYGSWLPKSKKRVRKAPHLEIYDERFDAESAASVMELCVPVE